MGDRITRYLQISKNCFLCNKNFSAEHTPVSLLACGHIFGLRCLMISLHGGDVDLGNLWSPISDINPSGVKCPGCQCPITNIDHKQTAISILRDISSDLPDYQTKLNAFVGQLRESIAKVGIDIKRENMMQFLKQCYTSDGDDILQKALHDAASAGDYFSPFHDAITTSRNGNPESMSFPLIRLCFLLWDVHNVIRKKTSLSINVLLWEGNRCLGVDKPLVHWKDVEDAADLEGNLLFPLLHCFTMLASQALARSNLKDVWRGEERTELARKFACERIGKHFEGRPSLKWLQKLAVVVDELKRHQFEMSRKPLVGLAAEKGIVRGWWAIAKMEAEDATGSNSQDAESG
ncbi:uncharacterized protein K460DRAFT_336233 [Cucurbitaria berberidis CBS 394.84]|uniref:RING-type domain-containing protein n=1 Tax=Cucurbitaria berberidis CBS 394.84 TaxID=1168544 RepID=A0A9P4LA28_9PLEO|nr:uncharacterized protein K460DRAFT_336233 [Cucurbitaria berberidis CBS 394.84]KAF1846814.1 hypothetical protein K460DRAFT_336233 [Cucurbitaria berberidis CBS 394.84]